eukprot:NODE_323_length_10965_cov_0.441561.p2 type:complete len:419 gc:universal NODE_323_length_10965_cov_0.441561:10620-9364(-)
MAHFEKQLTQKSLTLILHFATMKLLDNCRNFIKLLSIFLLLCLLSELIVRSYPKSSVSFNIDWQVNKTELEKYSKLTDKPWNLTFDGHIHTRYSDGYLTGLQLIEYEIANGFDVIFPTEHNSLFGALEIRKLSESYNVMHNTSLLVIPGFEYSCCRIHMNFVGIESDADLLPITNFPSDQELERVIKLTHDRKGLVIVNHLPWSLQQRENRLKPVLQDHPTKEQLLEWGVDGFEVVNGNVLDWPTLQFCIDNELIIWAGSDIHWPSYPFSWNALMSEKTQQGVLDALRHHKNTIISHPYPENLYQRDVHEQSSFLAPIDAINTIFKSFYILDGGTYSFVDGTCHVTQFYLDFNVIFSFIFWIFMIYIFYTWISFIYIGRVSAKWIRYFWMCVCSRPDFERNGADGNTESEELLQGRAV